MKKMLSIIFVSLGCFFGGFFFVGCGCTLLSCSYSVSVTLERNVSFSKGSYHVNIQHDLESFQCQFLVNEDGELINNTCKHPSLYMIEKEHEIKTAESFRNSWKLYGIRFSKSHETPSLLSVKIVKENTEWFRYVTSLQYSLKYPNGMFCKPTCVSSEARVIKLPEN